MPDRRVTDYLVCYDIRDPRRLRRVHRCMREWGTPLQYSVFHCRLSERQRRRVTVDLRRRIDERVDDVRIYSMQTGGAIDFQGVHPLPAGMFINNLVLRRDESGSQR